MNKKKAIKIATATAIVASAFTAVAPAQSEAATSLTSQIKTAQAAMKKPYTQYTKSKKLASASVIKKQIAAAKSAQTKVNTAIKKSKLSTKAKNVYYKQVKSYSVYITRAQGYLTAITLNTRSAQTALETAIESGNVADVEAAQATLTTKLAAYQKAVAKVYSSSVRKLLTSTYATQAKAAVVAADQFIAAAQDDAKYPETLKAVTEKVDAYVALANGDLTTQVLVDAANTAKAAIDLKDIKDADKTALQTKIDAANVKVAAAVEALKGAIVESVSAINSTEVLVKTNKNLSKDSANDEANYSVFINGAAVTDTIADAQLQADGKSVLVRFTTPLANGNTVKVATKNTLLTSDYKSIPAFTGDTVVFSDTKAPKLQSVSFNGTDVVAAFDEPVSSVANIKVNGVTATLGAATATTAGNYEYKLTGAATAVGDYNVVLSDVKDSNNNVAGTLTGSYKVVADSTVPAVSNVEATGQNTLKITFNKSVASFATVANNLVVKKGAGTIDASRLAPVLSTDKKSVTVTVTAADAQLPLYATSETTASLNVSFNNYKDASGLLGAPYSGTVTLSKDATAPTILSKNLIKIDAAKTVITVKYNEAVDAQDAQKTGIVIKKDGIVQSTLAKPTVANDLTDLEGKTVTFTFGGALADANYTFDLPKGIVKDKSLNDSAVDSFSLNVSSTTAYIQPVITAPTDNTNQIKLAYGTDMTDSATVLANYKLDDASLPTGTTVNFVDDKKNVVITLPKDYPVVADANYKLTVTNDVKAVNGSVVATAVTGTVFTSQVGLKDNVAPELKTVTVVKESDVTKFKTLKLTFSENLAATVASDVATKADFKVLVNGSAVPVNAIVDTTPSDKELTLVIGDGTEVFNVSQAATVTIVSEGTDNPAIDVKDAGGNKLKAGATFTAIQ